MSYKHTKKAPTTSAADSQAKEKGVRNEHLNHHL